MIGKIRVVYDFFDKKEKISLIRVLVLVMCAALFETAVIFFMVPFMGVVMNPETIDTMEVLVWVKKHLELDGYFDFLNYFSIFMLIFVMISSIVSALNIWSVSSFGQAVGARVSVCLFEKYMDSNWEYHLRKNSSELMNMVTQEVYRFTNLFLMQLLNMISKLVLAIVIVVGLLMYRPDIAITGAIVFIISYFITFKVVGRKLHRNSVSVSESNHKRMKYVQEGIGAIKELKLSSREDFYKERYRDASDVFAKAEGESAVIAQAPRYILELIVFGGLILSVVYLLNANAGSSDTVLPTLSVFALASLKLMPAFQQVYNSITVIKANYNAVEKVVNELSELLVYRKRKRKNSASESFIRFDSTISVIELSGIHFSYGDDTTVLNDINLKIRKGDKLGIVGSSGSGKSTLVDIIIGLLSPSEGGVYINGKLLGKEALRQYQNKIGYVQQSVFLTDSTIKQNIALGEEEDTIDNEKLCSAIQVAKLAEVVSNNRMGVNEPVGENGVQLSGGQRQRIGIARALYRETEILVFDEATSALDNLTEKWIVDTINSTLKDKTVITIAHRLNTVKNCDKIIYMENGSISDVGTFDELVAKNKSFSNMARG